MVEAKPELLINDQMTEVLVQPDVTIASQQEFAEYIATHLDNRARGCLIYLFQDISGQLPPIPMHMRWYSSWSANPTIVKDVIKIHADLHKHGFQVEGFSADGDRAYFPEYIWPAYTSIMQICIVEQLAIPKHFPDINHATKNIRKQLTTPGPGGALCYLSFSVNMQELENSPSMQHWVGQKKFSIKEMRTILPDVPQLVWDPKANSMDDDLPRKLFTLDNVKKLRDKDNIEAATFVLIPALFLFAFTTKNCSTVLRKRALIIAIAYLLPLNKAYDRYESWPKKDSPVQTKSKKSNRVIFPFNRIQTRSLLVLAINSMIMLKKPIKINTLGTQNNEHVNGNLRQLMSGNNTQTGLTQAMQQLVKKHVLHDVEKRIFDNDILTGEEEIEFVDELDVYLASAILVLEFVGVPIHDDFIQYYDTGKPEPGAAKTQIIEQINSLNFDISDNPKQKSQVKFSTKDLTNRSAQSIKRDIHQMDLQKKFLASAQKQVLNYEHNSSSSEADGGQE